MYKVIKSENHLIKAWIENVPVEEQALQQLKNVASMPFVFKHLAVMPDVHFGRGATIGSVIPTKKAIIPAAVGVDIGCGMMAVKTDLTASLLPDNLGHIRNAIEKSVPHGRTDNGRKNDRGAWGKIPSNVRDFWAENFSLDYQVLIQKHPKAKSYNNVNHLGTLGTGNHFIEVCLDENDYVWVMLHSGSRGMGNRFGTYFIEKAKLEMEKWFVHLPDKDLAYIPEGSDLFEDYFSAVDLAQRFAESNRVIMMNNTLRALSYFWPEMQSEFEVINCHHNYVARENHFGENIWVTRKGAVRARKGDLGIIPGSMGAKSYIVRGLGNPEAFHSCSHGAGRAMSRSEAKKRFTLEDHAKATQGVECRKDSGVIDKTPKAYKNIDAVMEAQKDLVEIVHTLKQVVCVKG